MHTFEIHARIDARPEEVWKLLYDPARFPQWWVGFESVEVDRAPGHGGAAGQYTMYQTGYPDFPMPQLLESAYEDRTVKISCLVSDLRFEWRLESLDDGESTAITARVEIPDNEARRVTTQQDVIRGSVARLAELAASRGVV